MICIARGLGAPDRAAGKQAVSTSNAVRPHGDAAGHRRHDVHDVRIPLDGHEVDDLDGARLADPSQVVASEVDEHEVLGALLGVGDQLVGEGLVLLDGGAARPGARDGVHHRLPVLDLDEGLRGGPDDVEPVEAEQVHVRGGVGRPQHAVDVQRAGRARRFEALGGDDLEGLAGSMRSLTSSTAARKSGPPQSAVYSGSSEGGSAAGGWETARERSASMASRRATASA